MNKTKKTVTGIIIAVLVVALIVAAIVLLKKDNFGMNSFQRKQAVAEVAGEKVTASEFATVLGNYYANIDNYNSYAMYYGYGQYFDTSTDEGMASLKQYILDSVVEEKAYIALAKEYGITLTAEEEADCAQQGRDSYDGMIDSYEEQYKEYGYAEPRNYALNTVSDYLSKYGIGSKKEYIRRATESARASLFQEKVNEKWNGERAIADEEMPGLYEAFVEEDYIPMYYDGVISTYDEYFIKDYQKIRFPYVPDDFLFVRVIEAKDLTAAEKMLADINGSAEKFEEYCMSEDNLDGLMPKVGADEGYAIGEHDSSFGEEVYATAEKLEVGGIELVRTGETDSDGKTTERFFVIRRIEGQTGIVPYEKNKDTFGEEVKEHALSEYRAERMDAWLEDGHLTTYPGRVDAVKVA